MIPAGLANSLVAWATDPSLTTEQKTTRKGQLRTERDACVSGALNDGKGLKQLESAAENGKSFTALATLTAVEKLTVLNEALSILGMVDTDYQPAKVTYATFENLAR